MQKKTPFGRGSHEPPFVQGFGEQTSPSHTLHSGGFRKESHFEVLSNLRSHCVPKYPRLHSQKNTPFIGRHCPLRPQGLLAHGFTRIFSNHSWMESLCVTIIVYHLHIVDPCRNPHKDKWNLRHRLDYTGRRSSTDSWHKDQLGKSEKTWLLRKNTC